MGLMVTERVNAHVGMALTYSGLSSSAITRVHADLLERLALLDRLGEHVAAAHLAAAIDALEERLDDQAPRPSRTDDPVEAMARGLVARFDDRATEAARSQMKGASGQTLLVWAAILSRIDMMLVRQTADS